MLVYQRVSIPQRSSRIFQVCPLQWIHEKTMASVKCTRVTRLGVCHRDPSDVARAPGAKTTGKSCGCHRDQLLNWTRFCVFFLSDKLNHQRLAWKWWTELLRKLTIIQVWSVSNGEQPNVDDRVSRRTPPSCHQYGSSHISVSLQIGYYAELQWIIIYGMFKVFIFHHVPIMSHIFPYVPPEIARFRYPMVKKILEEILGQSHVWFTLLATACRLPEPLARPWYLCCGSAVMLSCESRKNRNIRSMKSEKHGTEAILSDLLWVVASPPQLQRLRSLQAREFGVNLNVSSWHYNILLLDMLLILRFTIVT